MRCLRFVLLISICLPVAFVQTTLAQISGTTGAPANSSEIVYENTNTAAAATFDFVATVGGDCPAGPVIFNWTDAEKNAHSYTLSTGCGSLAVRASLPAMAKGGTPPAITVANNGTVGLGVTWTVQEVK